MTDPSTLPPNPQDAAIAGIDRKPWGWLLLFGSSATLICCALPIALIGLGLGSLSAALFANLPFLGVLALHKGWLFVGSGIALAVGGWALYRPGRACPTDPQLAQQCEHAHFWNTRLWGCSIVIWLIGAFAAYAALPLWQWLGVGD